MLSTNQTETIKKITAKYDPSMVGVFGSYARNENTRTSDLDLLVDFNGKLNLLELIGIEQELSEILGIKVDLVTTKSLSDQLRPYIEKDLIRLI